MDYDRIWTEQNNDGEGSAACECAEDCDCSINDLDDLGTLIVRSEADDKVAVYDDVEHVTIVGDANGPWAIRVPNYTVLVSDFGPGDYTAEDAAAACERMEAYLGRHFRVRLPRSGEAEGTYEVYDGGRQQILGYSIPCPEWVAELTNAAWDHACQSWPEE